MIQYFQHEPLHNDVWDIFYFYVIHYWLPLERGAPTLEVVKIKVNAR